MVRKLKLLDLHFYKNGTFPYHHFALDQRMTFPRPILFLVQSSSEGCGLAKRLQRRSDSVQRSSDGTHCAVCYKAGPGFKSQPGTPWRTLFTERHQWGFSIGSRRFIRQNIRLRITFPVLSSRYSKWKKGCDTLTKGKSITSLQIC